MTTPLFHGQVTKGRLVLETPHRYLVYLSGLEGKRVEVVVRKQKSQRSIQQNKYYWAVVVEILANHCGYEPEEMHEALKVKFLSDHSEDDKGLIRIGSTAKLTTDGFVKYIDRIIRWASGFGVFIPDPNQTDCPEAMYEGKKERPGQEVCQVADQDTSARLSSSAG